MELSLQELEAAINFWRDQRPARGNEYALSAEVKILARVYALMIYQPCGQPDARPARRERAAVCCKRGATRKRPLT